MKRLLFFTIILAATVQAQIIKPVQVTIFSTGATVTQDSLDAKLNRPEFDTLFGADSVYARALFARDTTYRKAQEAAIKALLVADTLYRAAQTALLKTAAYMDS